MGKIIRRAVAALLAITGIILICIPSSNASATTQKGDFVLEGSTLVSYTGDASELTLPNSITAIGKDAFSGNKKLTKVVLPDSVKKIDYAAFENCSNLVKVSLGDGIKSIGSSVFSGCINLESVNIPEKCEEIGSGVFAGCTSLSSVDISSLNRHYICLDGVIYTKDGSSIVQYLPGRTSSVYTFPASVCKIGEYAFWGADSLTNVTVSRGVKEIPEYAFSNCNSLGKVILPDSVESLFAYSFADCPNLASIAMPDSVGYIDDKAFYLSNGATIQFVAPDGNTRKEVSVSSIADAVSDDNVIYSSDVATDDISADKNDGNDDNASGNISSKTNDDYIGSYSGSSNWVTVINNRDFSDNNSANDYGSGKIVGGNAMFIMPTNLPVRGFDLDGAESEDSVALSGGNTSLKNDEFNIVNGILASYNGTQTAVTVPNGVENIGNRAFYDNSVIDSVVIPDGVEKISDFAFSRSTVSDVILPSSVKDIGYAAFYHCENIENINIPSGVSNIELGAFDGTKWLDNWKNADDGNSYLVVGDGILIAYKGDGGNISLPSGVKQIGAGCFEGNKSITGVTVPQGVVKIGEDAFNGCNKLEMLTLPEGLETIEDRAFCDTALPAVQIPDSVKGIGLGAFDTTGNLTPLKTVLLYGNDVPNVIYKDTATRLSASDLRVDALNGVENVIVQSDCDLDSGTLFNPVYYGFHGQIYCISDDSTGSNPMVSLLRSTKRPDINGNVNIDSSVKVAGDNYMINGVKEHAFDAYLDYAKWCDFKPESLTVSGNASSDLNSLLSSISSSIPDMTTSEQGIKVKVEGSCFGSSDYSNAQCNDIDSAMTLVVSEAQENSDDIMAGLYNYYGNNVSVNMVPLEISLYDKNGVVQIHKLGNSKMDVTIPLPSNFSNYSEGIKIASLDENGSLTELPSSVEDNGGNRYIKFVANHFSDYVIYVKNETTMVNEENGSDNFNSADNGESYDANVTEESSFFDDGSVAVTAVVNSEDPNSGVNSSQGIMGTLNKSVGTFQTKWIVAVILFGLAAVLALYRPAKRRK